ncbi:WD40 repeat-like protein [Cristinia sonorae]|uniref:WD40 repeat-like protein n=1 Tax=Cristinia sonorae TaxID=1940300 RepID=A0A8K0XTX2_9AGAR|nr:WD40 repeat-like protein [Cristinia sonorae]
MAISTEMTSRTVLTNRTNVDADGDDIIMGIPLAGPSNDRKRPLANTSQQPLKRARRSSALLCDFSSEDEDAAPHNSFKLSGRRDVHGLRMRAMGALSSPTSIYDYPTRSLLRSFVSSDKADLFKCHSTETNAFVSLPYACSYTHAAKRGATPLLAVATEQGFVHILNTSRRREWDVEPQRTTFQPYANGIFDVQWSHDDTLIATACGGQRAQVSQVTPTGVTVLHQLTGHTGTVKCVSWDPTRAGSVLSTGGRDGNICVWDLRVEASLGECAPVIKITGAHDEQGQAKPRARKGRLAPAPPMRSVTSLVYSPNSPNKLVSSGSVDGILRQWDLLMPDMIKRRSSKPKAVPTHQSSMDPTMYQGTRRTRGISSLSLGIGPSSGYLFASGNDSLVHTYEVASLEALSGRNMDDDPWSYGHPNMKTGSFFVRSALSPCGRWLASGGADKGSVFLYDVSGTLVSRFSGQLQATTRRRGVQLCGQTGEVGVVDWADGMLASCADDGTVRIWRPDMEKSLQCQSDPEEMKWNWKWASDDLE